MTFASPPTFAKEDVLFADECNAKLQKVKDLSNTKDGFECTVIDDLEVVSASRNDENTGGTIIMRYPSVKRRHLNNNGNIHGGALATWIDVVTSLAIWFYSGVSTVSVSLHVDYVGAAKEGCDLLFSTNVTKCGKTLSFATCQVTTHDGKVIANASHTVARARL